MIASTQAPPSSSNAKLPRRVPSRSNQVRNARPWEPRLESPLGTGRVEQIPDRAGGCGQVLYRPHASLVHELARGRFPCRDHLRARIGGRAATSRRLASSIGARHRGSPRPR